MVLVHLTVLMVDSLPLSWKDKSDHSHAAHAADREASICILLQYRPGRKSCYITSMYAPIFASQWFGRFCV